MGNEALKETSSDYRPEGYDSVSETEPIYINIDVVKRLHQFCKEHKPELGYSDGIDMLLNIADDYH